MATIKSFTDLEQSKVLSKILPLESADMTYYACVRDWRGNPVKPRWGKPANALRKEMAVPCANHQVYEYVSAWSLAALLGVLPKGTNISTPKPINELGYCCWNQYDEIYADNPVDACVQMIIKLHELNLL